MSSKDYYKILQIPKTAGQEEIKKAYRKLALKFHPDRNAGNANAEERFKEINEAYAVLSDPEKRKQYDMFGAEGFHSRFNQEDIFRNFEFGKAFRDAGLDPDDFLGQMFGSLGSRFRRSAPKRQHFYGHQNDSNPFGGRSNNSQLKGPDVQLELQISFQESILGGERTVSYQLDGTAKRLTIKIPPGIEQGKKLRIAGKGSASKWGGSPGDLYVRLSIAPHAEFQREGQDIVITRSIKLSEAMRGTEVEVPTLDGKTLRLKIPAGTQSHRRFRLRGKGVPANRGSGGGDQLVEILVSIPANDTPELERIAKELAATSN